MISLQVFYEGNVQGVGFRWTVRHAAKGFDVTGWVRNLPDGRVELQVTGEEDEVRAFLDRIAQGELHSLIHKQTENKLEKPLQPAALKFAMTDSPRSSRTEADPAVAVHGLTKIFPVPLHPARGIVAVKDLNLRIEPGEVFGLLGPNGSGKSTTLKIILGLVSPTRGRTEIFGRDSRLVESREAVGFLPENPYFYKYLTGEETLRFFGRLCGLRGARLKERINELLELVGLTKARKRRLGTYSKGHVATHWPCTGIDS